MSSFTILCGSQAYAKSLAALPGRKLKENRPCWGALCTTDMMFRSAAYISCFAGLLLAWVLCVKHGLMLRRMVYLAEEVCPRVIAGWFGQVDT